MEEIVVEDLILLNSSLNTKEEVIDWIVRKANDLKIIHNSSIFNKAVMKREKELSTAIGYKVAMPHGKSDVVNRPFVGLVRTKEEFKWDEEAEVDEKVKLVFLIGVPESNKNNIHLKVIANISKKLLDDHFRSQLLELNSKEAIQRLLNNKI